MPRRFNHMELTLPRGRGSVIPLFIRPLKAGHPVTVTDPNMTRFMMTLDDAVDLVVYAFENGNTGDIFVQKSPAATIEVLAAAVKHIMKAQGHKVLTVGTRHGEKLFEVILSREERAAAQDLGTYYRVPPDLRDLNYGKFVEDGEPRITASEDYNSHNTERLDVAGMCTLLRRLPFIQAIERGEPALAEE